MGTLRLLFLLTITLAWVIHGEGKTISRRDTGSEEVVGENEDMLNNNNGQNGTGAGNGALTMPDGYEEDFDVHAFGVDENGEEAEVVDKKKKLGKDDDGDDDGGNGNSRRKRSPRITLLSRPEHPMQVSLVEISDHHREKRTSFNRTGNTWPHKIPFVFDPKFDMGYAGKVKRLLKIFEDMLCVTFHLEENHDKSNPNWFRDNGYSTNAYINFVTSPTCVGLYGRGEKDKGPRLVSPCSQFFTMMHEVLHSLGALHAQKYPLRRGYITINKANIMPNRYSQYSKIVRLTDDVVYDYFDSSSPLMYGLGYFTSNGLDTMSFLRPEMGHLTGPNTFKSILMEMNKNYKCVETYCDGIKKDCGFGYYGYPNQQCGCICPDGYDPKNDCKTPISGNADDQVPWPDTPATLYKAGASCPAGYKDGLIPMTGSQNPRMRPQRLKSEGKRLDIELCSKTTPASGADFSQWPIGSYCVGKVKGVPCTEPFEEGEFTVETTETSVPTGETGDITVSGNTLTIRYCCRREGDLQLPMRLPSNMPFRLTKQQSTCQAVEGMRVLNGFIDFATTKSGVAGKLQPATTKMKLYFRHTSCYYYPPKYDCNEEIKLDAGNPSKTFGIPGAGTKREPNRRCFYSFKVPIGSRIKISIETKSMHPEDFLLVRRFNQWQNPYRYLSHGRTTEFVSEGTFLLMESWTSLVDDTNYKGLVFKADLLLPEKSCYDTTINGQDYNGIKSISETYEKCHDWKDAAHCQDFPFDQNEGLEAINSGNYCRNPGGRLLQPYCYVAINGSVCIKRYCDVCNEMKPRDVLSDCSTRISNEPKFCQDALGRFGCFVSCSMNNENYEGTGASCGKPTLPSDGTSAGLANSYEVGAKIDVACKTDSSLKSEMVCLHGGWTVLSTACEATCEDMYSGCQAALTGFGQLCEDPRSAESAKRFCKKTCGFCGDTSAKCKDPASATFTRTSSSETIAPGKTMTFACNSGTFHVSGDLTMACSTTGQLLGTKPVCEASPDHLDINVHWIRERRNIIFPRHAVLMDDDRFRVPLSGKLTRWYFACDSNNLMQLLVYRKNAQGVFQLVGSNQVKCVAGWPSSYNVPANQQINVEDGDVYGVYSDRLTLFADFCNGAPTKLVQLPLARAPNFKLLMTNPNPFRGKTCMLPSLGIRVEP